MLAALEDWKAKQINAYPHQRERIEITVLAMQDFLSDDEIMLITTGGVLIRTRVSEVRALSRSTQGVRLINLDKGETLAGLERIVEPEEEEEEA